MNFNLKNRPNLQDFRWIWDELQKAYVDREDEDVTFYLFVEEWFEGFEKELREGISKWNNTPNQFVMGYISALREILGEASQEGSVKHSARNP